MAKKKNADLTITSPLQRVLDKTRDLQEEIKNVGQSSIKEMFVELFKQFPSVQDVQWTQYTPHFNDGDPCVFRVNDPEVRFTEGTLIALKHEGDRSYPEEDEYADDDTHYDTWCFRVQQKPIADAVNAMYTVFQEIDQVMQAVFGDGVVVKVSRDGEIEINEYDHD